MASKRMENQIPSQYQPVMTVSENRNGRFVVVRDGYRVSDEEYTTPDDPKAIAEADFWNLVATKHSWGERVDIVEYDNKRHRVY